LHAALLKQCHTHQYKSNRIDRSNPTKQSQKVKEESIYFT